MLHDVALLAVAFAVGAVAVLALERVRRWRARLRRDDPAGSRALQGAIGRVAVGVPAGGVGVLACRVRGRRIVLPARDDDGHAIARGTLVVVVSLERGTARITPLVLDDAARAACIEAPAQSHSDG